jgi:hypothetical protein
MKRIALLIAAITVSSHAMAKSCEELKREIAAKIEASGVTEYTLEIVPNEQIGQKKVVGSCDRGTKKIVYTRK